jgi:hypothetical protein
MQSLRAGKGEGTHALELNRNKLSKFFFVWWDWSLNSGLCVFKAGALLLESPL